MIMRLDETTMERMHVRRLPALVFALLMMGFAISAGSGSMSEEESFTIDTAGSILREDARVVDDDPCWPLDAEGLELALTLESHRTRDARALVWVMQNAAPDDDRLTLHLSIAHAETRGRILAVSGSGAAGLAQATPIAVLGEKVDGPLFITKDYIRGAEAYFLKKPLGDADNIATFLLSGGTRDRAAQLLAAAWELRMEGFDELDLLTPWADEAFDTRRAAAEQENVETLEKLGDLIESGVSMNRMRQFRDKTRTRYRELRNVQRRSWRAYRDDLTAQRDTMLREIYGVEESRVFEAAAYDAGELLSSRLDVRFSPTLMAKFLSRHLETKRGQAVEMGIPDEELERFAVGLYNSGAPNMKRMRSGLIGSLRETDKYMQNVPEMRDTLNEGIRH